MSLSDKQRERLDVLADFTEDTFLQPQYASMIREIFVSEKQQGSPIHAADAGQWALEREWKPYAAGALAGVAYAVEHVIED